MVVAPTEHSPCRNILGREQLLHSGCVRDAIGIVDVLCQMVNYSVAFPTESYSTRISFMFSVSTSSTLHGLGYRSPNP